MSSMVWIGVGTAPGVSSHSQTHSTHLRINFSEAMNNDADLVDVSNYTISGLNTVSVVRVDSDTVDIMFDFQIPAGSTTINISGPKDTSLNAMSGNYTFTAIDNFELVSVSAIGTHSFLAEFSRAPYVSDSGAQSALSIPNWSVFKDGEEIAVSNAKVASDYSDRHITLTVAEEIYYDTEYSIISSRGIMDEDLVDYAEETTETSQGYTRRAKKIFEIVSGNKSHQIGKSTSRHGSILHRDRGRGYVLRRNEHTLMRTIVRLIFSKKYYHMPDLSTLGLEPKEQANFKLELMKKAIVDLCKKQKDVKDASCSLKYTPKTSLLEIRLSIKTNSGVSVVSFTKDREGMVEYG